MDNKVEIFFQTTAGKFFLATLFGLILYVSIGKNFFIAPALIFFCSIFYTQRIYILSAATVCGWIFFDSLFNFIRMNLKESQVNLFHAIVINQFGFLDNKFLYTKIATLVVLCFLFFVLHLYSFFYKRINPILYLLFITLITICSTIFFEQQSWFVICAITLSCCLMKFIWFFAYYLTDRVPGKSSLLGAVLSVEPIWIFNFHRVHSIPRGSIELSTAVQKNVLSLSKCQISGIKLALASMFFKLGAQFLEMFLFHSQGSSILLNYVHIPSLNLINPSLIGLAKYNQLDVSLLQLWTVVLVRPMIYFLFEPIGNAGLLVAFLRLLGFQINRNFYKPYNANTFSNFLHRIYFYYSSILIHFFYLPIFFYLSEFKVRSKYKIFFSTFLAISLGGLIMSYFRNNISFIDLGAVNWFYMTLLKMPYLVSIATLAAVSNIVDLSKFRLNQHLKIGVFYFLYCIAFSLQGYFVTDSFGDIFRFFLKLSALGNYIS